MKKAVRIRTISQWYLLEQLNGYLGKRKIPKAVMRKIFYTLCSGEFGKGDFLVICIKKIKDDYVGLEEIVDMYPYHFIWDEKIDEICITRGNKDQSWYVSHARIRGQKTKVAVFYTTNSC